MLWTEKWSILQFLFLRHPLPPPSHDARQPRWFAAAAAEGGGWRLLVKW